MQLENNIAALQKLPLFAGMEHDDISTIALSSERLAFEPGEMLTREGELGMAAYLLLAGTVRIHEGESERRRVRMVSPGAIIGEMAMLVEYSYSSTVIAMEEVEVLELSRPMIHMLMQEFPSIAEHFSRRIHARLAMMAENLRRFSPSGTPTGQGDSLFPG